MTPRRRRGGIRPLVASATVACLALLLSACGGNQAQSPPSINTLPTATATPKAEKSVVVTGLSEGVNVTVSPGEPGTSPGGGLDFVSPIYTLGPTGPLGGRATVTIALDHPVPVGTTVKVGTRPSDTGSWSWLPATLTADAQHARFTTDSFSQFGVLTQDVSTEVSTYQDGVHTALTSTTSEGPAKPTCQDTKVAHKDGYKVASWPRDTLGWCLGMDKATHVLTVMNRRSSRSRSRTAPPRRPRPRARSTASGRRGTASSPRAAPTPSSRPVGTVTFDADLDPGNSLLVQPETSAKAQSTRALYAAVGALVSQLQTYGSSTPSTEQAFQSLVARPQCADALGQGSVLLQEGCLAPARLAQVLGDGVGLLRPVLRSPGIKAFWNRQFAFLAQQDKDTDSQHIIVGVKTVDFGDLVGSFTGHTRTLTVSKTGLVTERVDDGTSPVIQLTYQLSSPKVTGRKAGAKTGGTTTAQALLKAVKIYDKSAVGGTPPKVGDTGTITFKDGIVTPPYLQTTYCNAATAAKGAVRRLTRQAQVCWSSSSARVVGSRPVRARTSSLRPAHSPAPMAV